MDDHEFRQIIESIKLRAPIEEFVRDRVPALKRAGALYEACCPFHEERTPSFKVDPRRATWRCYGACGAGGDVISFVQRFDGSSFRETIEILARQVGAPLPASWARRDPKADAEGEARYAVLAEAETRYARTLAGAEGAAARAYLQGRGLDPAVVEAFGLGFAPAQGSPLVEAASGEGRRLARLEATGLARRSEGGRWYDFFRGRLMIPIRDRLGRTVGFGGRLLGAEGPGQPKYVNTAETAFFRKGRLIYGLDMALEHARKERRLILVEGYTDVMAAHQVGLRTVCAVLGTALTEEHAGLVRQSGARRVTLVFDGDEAGRQATRRALHGLLPLEVEIDVQCPPPGRDPCELFLEPREGDPDLKAQLEQPGRDWFEFLVEGCQGLQGRELAAAVDQVLELLLRLSKPVHRESKLAALARALELPVEAVREQWQELAQRHARRPQRQTGRQAGRQAGRQRDDRVPGAPDARSGSALGNGGPGGRPGGPEGPVENGAPEAARPGAGAAGRSGGPEARSSASEAPAAPLLVRAYRELAGATLVDNSLIPAFKKHFASCPHAGLAKVLSTLTALYERGDDEEVIDAGSLLSALGEDPVRELVVPLEQDARQAESARVLAEGAVACLERQAEKVRLNELASELRRANESGDERRREHLLRAIGAAAGRGPVQA